MPSPPPGTPEEIELGPPTTNPSIAESQLPFGASTTSTRPSSTSAAAEGEAEGDGEAVPSSYIAALPPVDRGKHAYMFLLGAVTIELMVWGMPYTIGILLNHWTTVLFPEAELGTLTLAGTLQSGLLYFMCAIMGPIYAAKPHRQYELQVSGLLISSAGIIASGFVTQAWQLIVTAGILYCFCAAVYAPIPTLIFEWFAQRRGLAGGILWSGTGVGGAVLPFLVDFLLKNCSYRVAMSITGLVFLVVNAVAILAIRRRVPLTMRRQLEPRRRQGIDWSFLKGSGMWIGAAYVLASGLGSFTPTLWIPTFVQDLGGQRLDGTALIALMSAASIPGQMGLGWMADHWSIRTVVLSNCLFAAVSVFLFWGFAVSQPMLTLFSITWGLSGLSATGYWTKIISDAAGDNLESGGVIFSMYSACKGVGNIVTGPISKSLLVSATLPHAKYSYGFKNYVSPSARRADQQGGLIVYTGITWLLASATALLFKG